jgi:CBS domain-containing protein
MQVRDVMTHTVVSVLEDTPFKAVAETLIDHDISGVPVVDPGGFVVGIVTEADLIAKEAFPSERKRGIARFVKRMLAGPQSEWIEKAHGQIAANVMSTPVVSAAPDDDLHVVARMMIDGGVKRLPVIEAGRLVGIISRSDMIRVFARPDEDLRRTIERFLARCGYVEPDHRVNVSVFEGKVTLGGSVLYESDIHVAGSLVEATDGVVAVNNRLLYREADPRPADVRKAMGR